MNSIDWSKYKFHCSGLSNLMVKPLKKDELLSETTKAYLRAIWIEETFGRKRFIETPAMRKGTIVESDSLELIYSITGKKYFKNQKQLDNDWIVGTPDVNSPDDLLDIKNSWSIWTFMDTNLEKAHKDYYYQVLGYMWLTGKAKGSVLYTLMSAPVEIVEGELYRLSFKMPESEAEAYRNNFEYDDIPIEMRIKSFGFEFNQPEVDTLMDKITEARNYLSTLKL